MAARKVHTLEADGSIPSSAIKNRKGSISMYIIKGNKCFEEIIRFQDVIELEAMDVQTRNFLHSKITSDRAVIINLSGTFHPGVTFDTVVSDGAVQVTIRNTGNDSFPLMYNVTVL